MGPAPKGGAGGQSTGCMAHPDQPLGDHLQLYLILPLGLAATPPQDTEGQVPPSYRGQSQHLNPCAWSWSPTQNC